MTDALLNLKLKLLIVRAVLGICYVQLRVVEGEQVSVGVLVRAAAQQLQLRVARVVILQLAVLGPCLRPGASHVTTSSHFRGSIILTSLRNPR